MAELRIKVYLIIFIGTRKDHSVISNPNPTQTKNTKTFKKNYMKSPKVFEDKYCLEVFMRRTYVEFFR